MGVLSGEEFVKKAKLRSQVKQQPKEAIPVDPEIAQGIPVVHKPVYHDQLADSSASEPAAEHPQPHSEIPQPHSRPVEEHQTPHITHHPVPIVVPQKPRITPEHIYRQPEPEASPHPVRPVHEQTETPVHKPLIRHHSEPVGLPEHLREKFEHGHKQHKKEQKAKKVKQSASHVRHTMTVGDKVKFVLMRSFGNFLLLMSLYGVGATFGPALYYEAQFRVIQARGIEYEVHDSIASPMPTNETPSSEGTTFGDVLAGSTSQVLVPPDTQFSLVIPKIGATSKVNANVDPLNEQEYKESLLTGVAHAKGTVFPGMQGNVYLFSHSTDNFWNVGRYNAVFYLLKELKSGDDIIVFFENARYNYEVSHTVIKDANDVDLLVKSQVPGKEQLILQTCWPPGTTWKRLFVIATPKE